MSNFDRMHILLQWGGKLAGGEEWSNSMRMANDATGDVSSNFPDWDTLQGWVDGYMADAVQAFWESTTIHTTAKLSFLKANIVKMDGHYLDQRTHEHTFPDLPGGSNSPQYPNQVALAVSLTTDYTRGPAHRGRFYVPVPAAPLEAATGLITDTSATTFANSAAALVIALSDTPGVDALWRLNVCVMSRAVGKAATNKVRGVAVGRVLDTQRRRRNAIQEDYHEIAVDLGEF